MTGFAAESWEPALTGREDTMVLKNQNHATCEKESRQRCEDSVIQVSKNWPQKGPRSPDFDPSPVRLRQATAHRILACGGEMKNCFALSRGNEVFMSRQIGDLDNPSTYDLFQQTIAYMRRILEVEPKIVACDMHPEYLSTKWAREQPNVRVIAVQHHHAHFASVLAEHKLDCPAIGIILDGTGYGTDGTIWGGEVISGTARKFVRHAWLEPTPMPGGAAAIRQPWRMALSHLYRELGPNIGRSKLRTIQRRSPQEIDVLLQVINTGVNSPLTSSCGRLFDAVAAMLDVCDAMIYDAQAAIELECLALSCKSQEIAYEEAVSAVGKCDGPIALGRLFDCLVRDISHNVAYNAIAMRFHLTVAAMFARAASDVRARTGLSVVALSGGCMNNKLLLSELKTRLSQLGFAVFTNEQVPPNDGGLALGQILVADAFANCETINQLRKN